MNYFNTTSAIFTAYLLLSGSASALPSFNSLMAKATGKATETTPADSSATPAAPKAFALTRPMACSAAANHDAFVTELKKLDKPTDNQHLEGLLNCPTAYARMAELTKADFDGTIPDHLKVALKDELEGVEYGNLQIDNDHTYLTCVSALKQGLDNSICDTNECEKDDLKTKLKEFKSCDLPMLSAQIDGLVDDIISRKGVKGSVHRDTFLTEAKKIVNAAPVISVKASLEVNKRQEADQKKARDALRKLLDVAPPAFETEETTTTAAKTEETTAPA